MNKFKLLVFLCFFSCFVFSQNTDTTRANPPQPSSQRDSISDTNKEITPQKPNRTKPPNQKEKKYPKGYTDYKNGMGIPGQKPEYLENIYYGCNVMLRAYRSTYGSVFYYDFSPHVGYKFNDYFSLGVQVIYNNSVITYGTQSISYNLIGPGAFARVLLGQSNFFLQAEYDYLSVPSGYLGTPIKTRSWSDEKMVGIGYKSRLGEKLSYFVNLMFNVYPTYYSPYFTQPLVYRAGLVYNY